MSMKNFTTWDNLIIDDSVNITGRGLVFIIDLKRNKLINSDTTNDTIIKINDIIKHDDKSYTVTGIEGMRGFGYEWKKSIGVLVRENK